MLANGSGKSRSAKDGSRRPATHGTARRSRRARSGCGQTLREWPETGRGHGGAHCRHPGRRRVGPRPLRDLAWVSVGRCFRPVDQGGCRSCYGAAGRAFVLRIVQHPETTRARVRRCQDAFCAARVPDGRTARSAGWPNASASSPPRASSRLSMGSSLGRQARPAVPPAPVSRHGSPNAEASTPRRSRTPRTASEGCSKPTARAVSGLGQARGPRAGGQQGRLRPLELRRGRIKWLQCAGVFILPSTWREEVMRGLDAASVTRALANERIILCGKDGKPASTHTPPSNGKSVRLYRVNPDFLSD